MNQESVLNLKLSRVAFWGVIRALQSDINICYTPQISAPHYINKDLPGQAAACIYFRYWFSSTGCVVQQSVRYNFPPPSELLVCYQPHRQEVMPGQKSIYETFLVLQYGFFRP
jgi:hypothetical protein